MINSKITYGRRPNVTRVRIEKEFEIVAATADSNGVSYKIGIIIFRLSSSGVIVCLESTKELAGEV